MVPCPAFEEHLICLGHRVRRTWRELPAGRDAAPGLVHQHPGYALGISRPHPLAATGTAYTEAVHALAVARNSPKRVAAYQRQSSLVELLPRRGLAWARALTGPLRSMPKSTADVSRLVLSFPRTAVARLLSISRNTVAAHCRRAEETLNVDLGDVRTRARLDLALSLTDLEPDPALELPQVPPALDDLLRTEPAVAWRTLPPSAPRGPVPRRLRHRGSMSTPTRTRSERPPVSV